VIEAYPYAQSKHWGLPGNQGNRINRDETESPATVEYQLFT
jgi:hypothetical protein